MSLTKVPEVGPGMALVNVRYAGANFYDILMVQGKYQVMPLICWKSLPLLSRNLPIFQHPTSLLKVKPKFPFIPGTEFSGVIEQLGEGVTGWKVGQEVYGIAFTGAYAEKIAVPVNKLRLLPKGMSLLDVRCTIVN